MDPSLAISLHFSLEFIGVAAAGGVFAWALQTGARARAAAALVLLGVQIVHAGQFVEAEAAVVGSLWLAAVASLLVAVAGRPTTEPALWFVGWAAFAGARVVLAVLGPHPAFGDSPALQAGLHAAMAAGAAAVGAWVWRRTGSSVRLRIVTAFVLVLFVVVLAAGGPLATVVGNRVEAEQLRQIGTQAEAQRTVFRQSGADILARGPIVSDAIAQALAAGRPASDIATSIREQVFTDLSFIAVFGPGREILAESGMGPGEQVGVSGSAAVGQALRGETAPSLERVPQGLVAIGASPVYRAGRPRTSDNVVGVVALGIRFDASRLAMVGEATGLATALVSPSRGEVVAAGDGRLSAVALPADALRTAGEGGVWTGAVRSGGARFFAAAVPLQREDGTAPAAMVLASPDTVLARTTASVSRTLFAAVLAATLAAILIALLLARRISKPILDLTGVARRIESGDLAATATLPRGDEIGTLAGAFDSMTASLRDTIATEQETRTRLQTIVHGMGDALVAVDADFNVVQFNPAAERITGVAAGDAVGRKCHEVYGALTRGSDGRPICDYLCPLRHDGGADGSVGFQRAGARPLALAVSCSTLRDADGNVVGGVDLLRDVTSAIEAERMKSNVLSNLSHELRTPLTPIRGYADILRRRELPREQQERFLAEIVTSTERLERIVKLLVDVAAMDAGRLPLMPVPADAASIVREAVERWRGRAEQHKIRSMIARGLPTVLADEVLVGRVLDELVDNAVKFSPDGGPVVVAATSVDDGVRLAVTDKGIGISGDDQSRLADEFVQLDGSETRQFGGLGVGLTFVRRVIEGHGGRLDVDSRAGKGSTFSFVLPVQPDGQGVGGRTRRAPGRHRKGTPAGRAKRKPRAEAVRAA